MSSKNKKAPKVSPRVKKGRGCSECGESGWVEGKPQTRNDADGKPVVYPTWKPCPVCSTPEVPPPEVSRDTGPDYKELAAGDKKE